MNVCEECGVTLHDGPLADLKVCSSLCLARRCVETPGEPGKSSNGMEHTIPSAPAAALRRDSRRQGAAGAGEDENDCPAPRGPRERTPNDAHQTALAASWHQAILRAAEDQNFPGLRGILALRGRRAPCVALAAAGLVPGETGGTSDADLLAIPGCSAALLGLIRGIEVGRMVVAGGEEEEDLENNSYIVYDPYFGPKLFDARDGAMLEGAWRLGHFQQQLRDDEAEEWRVETRRYLEGLVVAQVIVCARLTVERPGMVDYELLCAGDEVVVDRRPEEEET